MNDPAGRYQLIETAISAPGYDWITRSEKGPFIDTGLEVKFSEFGRLYLSVDTVREMADAAGLFNEQGETDAQVAAHAAEYFRGYSDAVKENPNGHLADLVERLGAVAAALAGSGGVLVEESPALDAPDVEVTGPNGAVEPEVFTTDGPAARQVDSPARSKRAARISSSAGDEHRL